MSTFNLSFQAVASGLYNDGAGLSDLISANGKMPGLDLILSQGAGETWQQYFATLAVVSGSPQDLDLSGSLTDNVGRSIVLTKLYFAALALTTPDGVKSIQWGPQSVANAAQLWFGAASGSEIVDSTAEHKTPYGWTITPGTGDLLRINNPGSGTVGCKIWLVGKQ